MSSICAVSYLQFHGAIHHLMYGKKLKTTTHKKTVLEFTSLRLSKSWHKRWWFLSFLILVVSFFSVLLFLFASHWRHSLQPRPSRGQQINKLLFSLPTQQALLSLFTRTNLLWPLCASILCTWGFFLSLHELKSEINFFKQWRINEEEQIVIKKWKFMKQITNLMKAPFLRKND